MKKCAALVVIVSVALTFSVHARMRVVMDYDKQKAEADLIVIAKPIESRSLGEQTNLTENIRPPVSVIGVETTFQIQAILKGTSEKNTFTFHHYRLPEEAVVVSGPDLVSFDNQHQSYLMFLKKEKNRFTAISGQTDPADSIKKLK